MSIEAGTGNRGEKLEVQVLVTNEYSSCEESLKMENEPSPPYLPKLALGNKEPGSTTDVGHISLNIEETSITPTHSSTQYPEEYGGVGGSRGADATKLMSKILIPLAVGGIFLASEMQSFESVARSGVVIFWLSILFMVVGFNIKLRYRKPAVYLERVGHVVFYIGLMFICTPILLGPTHSHYFWVLPVFAALVFGSSVYFGWQKNEQGRHTNLESLTR